MESEAPEFEESTAKSTKKGGGKGKGKGKGTRKGGKDKATPKARQPRETKPYEPIPGAVLDIHGRMRVYCANDDCRYYGGRKNIDAPCPRCGGKVKPLMETEKRGYRDPNAPEPVKTAKPKKEKAAKSKSGGKRGRPKKAAA